MRHQVILTRGNHSEVYGTYASRAEADDVAATHLQAGYWSVTVRTI